MLPARRRLIEARSMAGQRQRKLVGIQAGQDPHRVFEAACTEFADEFGWEREFVCYWWSQIALAREYLARQSRELAEDGAWHNIREALDQRGREPN